MGIREAGARVGRDLPDLRGADRGEVLRGQPRPGSVAGAEGLCRHCGQAVKPAVRKFWGKAALFVATAQLVAVIVSVVACFTAVDPWKGLRRRLVSWPAAIHPVGLGVAAAVMAALAAAWFAEFLNERAGQPGSCPRCRNVLTERER